MKYWGPFSTGLPQNSPVGFTKEDLIKNSDGRCQSWQELMLASLAIQNNTSARGVIVTGSDYANPVGVYVAEGILVKSTALGQGGTNTARYFNNHAIVRSDTKVTGALYDPSYGKSYEGTTPKNSWETAALEGVYYKFDPAQAPILNKKSDSPNDEMCNYAGY